MEQIAILNPDTPDVISTALTRMDIRPIFTCRSENVSKPVSGHPDIQMFPYGGRLFCNPDISASFLKSVDKFAEVIICKTALSNEYPNDIAYNIFLTGDVALHRVSCTEPDIKQALLNDGIKFFNTPQGYTKCSAIAVDDNRIITADATIHKAAVSSGLSSLKIQPGHIVLPGYAYGFIGGASGCAGDSVLFTGGIDHHPDAKIIKDFILSADKKIVYLSGEPAIDLGSIFILTV